MRVKPNETTLNTYVLIYIKLMRDSFVFVLPNKRALAEMCFVSFRFVSISHTLFLRLSFSCCVCASVCLSVWVFLNRGNGTDMLVLRVSAKNPRICAQKKSFVDLIFSAWCDEIHTHKGKILKSRLIFCAWWFWCHCVYMETIENHTHVHNNAGDNLTNGIPKQ